MLRRGDMRLGKFVKVCNLTITTLPCIKVPYVTLPYGNISC